MTEILNRGGRVIVAASGYFDPIHYAHIEYLQKAKRLGDVLVVIVNNDDQAKLKKGFSFAPVEERINIIRALACVDYVVQSVDKDKTVCESLKMVRPHIFAKGGDQYSGNVPEGKICADLGIRMIDGLGEKLQSSRWLLKNLKEKLANVPEEYLNGE